MEKILKTVEVIGVIIICCVITSLLVVPPAIMFHCIGTVTCIITAILCGILFLGMLWAWLDSGYCFLVSYFMAAISTITVFGIFFAVFSAAMWVLMDIAS